MQAASTEPIIKGKDPSGNDLSYDLVLANQEANTYEEGIAIS
jgi:hypothetical protein